MEKRRIDDSVTARKSQLPKDFDKVTEGTKKVLASHYGDEFAETVARDTHQEFEALIPELPYVWRGKNRPAEKLIVSAWFLALFRVLERHGRPAEEAGKVTYESTEAYLSSLPKLPKLGLRLLWRVMFIGPGKKLIR